ncbi:MAG: hypothetical protein ACMUIG_04965 [Thermoplasmatota archaeon]
MEFIPGWALAASLAVLTALTFIFIASIVSSSSRRSLFLLGFRYSTRSPGETVAMALPVALLIGIVFASLSVGDGLYTMVEENTKANLSDVDVVISIPDFMNEEIWLNTVSASGLPIRDSAGIVDLNGLISGSGGGRRTGARIIGASDSIHPILPIYINGDRVQELPGRYECMINEETSDVLGIGPGENVRMEIHPGDLVGSSLIDYNRDRIEVFNLTVRSVIDNSGIGRFSADSSPNISPMVILERSLISDRLDRSGEVNSILVDIIGAESDDDLEDEMGDIRAALDKMIPGEEGGFALSISDRSGDIALRNADFFFEAGELDIENIPHIRTSAYFADSIRSGSLRTSYPVVAGLDTGAGSDIVMTGTDGSEVIPDLAGNEIIINNYTARVLNVTKGDTVTMDLRVVDNRGELIERRGIFTIVSVILIEGFGAENWYVPDVKGVTDAPTCSSWDDSFEVDISSIGKSDTDYWEMYSATPKAYISFDMASNLWGTENGDATAVIFNASETDRVEIIEAVDESVTLSSIGGTISAVKYQALRSSRGLLIFPGMFLTFGSVIMLGAVLSLIGIVRSVSLKRSRDWGILKGMGTSNPGLVHAGISESILPLSLGMFLGLIAGSVLSILINLALGSIWSDAVEGSEVPIAFSFRSAAVAAAIGITTAVVVLLLSIMREVRKVPGPNIQKSDSTVASAGRRTVFTITGTGMILVISGMILLLTGRFIGSGIELAGYFTVGAMLLSSGAALIIFTSIGRISDRSDLLLMLTANLSRRPGRNPLVIGVLSLTLAVALSLTAVGEIMERDVEDRIDSYGGGYEYIVETEFPMDGNMDDIDGRLPEWVKAVPILSKGDEGGKCSNINAPFPPRLLGMPREIAVNGSFGLVERDRSFDGDMDAWNGLFGHIDGKIPILVDQNTLTWIYYEGLGSVFELETSSGSVAQLLVVGVLEPSVLTGTFVMSDENLRSMHPRTSGYTYFLIDSDSAVEDKVLSDAFGELGPVIETAEDLALENLNYERSYLYLFREFLVFGLMVSMASAISFGYARTLTMRKELEIQRSIGVRRRRSIMYITAEHGTIFGTASIGALIGTSASLLIYSGSIGAGAPGLSVFAIGLTISILVFLTGIGSGYISSRIVAADYSKYVRRYQ